MRYISKKLAVLSAVFFAPLVVFAQIGEQPEDLGDIARLFLSIFDAFVPVVIGAALVFFLWGVARYLMNPENSDARTEGKNFMIYGIIALFVMISVWGLVQILTGTFGVESVIPFFPPPGSGTGF